MPYTLDRPAVDGDLAGGRSVVWGYFFLAGGGGGGAGRL